MVFAWLRERRRNRILESPFPDAWELIITRNMAHYRWLDAGERLRLRELVQVFVAEKNWEGAGGLVLDDEIRVTIAAQACLLILNLEHQLYRRVESIIVYPSTVISPPPPESFFAGNLQISEQPRPVLGQAFLRGPVILVWDAVRAGGRDPRDGGNVVYHEFAHKLDMLTGYADGVPPLRDHDTYQTWVTVLTEAYEELSRKVDQGSPTFLDSYALTNGSEFFAVATEHFFEQAPVMAKDHPALYRVLRDFYRQDPALRHS